MLLLRPVLHGGAGETALPLGGEPRSHGPQLLGLIHAFQTAELVALDSAALLIEVEAGVGVPLQPYILRAGREAVGDAFHRQVAVEIENFPQPVEQLGVVPLPIGNGHNGASTTPTG